MLLSVQHAAHVAQSEASICHITITVQTGIDLRLASHTSFAISSTDHGQPEQSNATHLLKNLPRPPLVLPATGASWCVAMLFLVLMIGPDAPKQQAALFARKMLTADVSCLQMLAACSFSPGIFVMW